MRVLILGGTTEATLLAASLAGRRDIAPILSLAGRTMQPAPAPIRSRIGGFGGVDGLCAYLESERIAAVIDATHPFASQISANASTACGRTGVPLAQFTRPAWVRGVGDIWQEVENVQAAVLALGAAPRRVFLTHGRLQLDVFAQAPQHFYLVRTIDKPAGLDGLPDHHLILARGPFLPEDEMQLMRAAHIDALVTKNSGGAGTYAKIAVARALGIEVIMLARPHATASQAFSELAGVLDWLAIHHATP